MPSYAFPPAPPTREPTPLDEVDRVVARLAEHRAAWLEVTLDERIALLGALIDGFVRVAPALVDSAAATSGFAPDDPRVGELWLSGPAVTVRNLRLLRRTLVAVRDHGGPRFPDEALSVRPSGQLVVRVFPHDLWDRLAFSGYTGEIRMAPGVHGDDLPAHTAARVGAPGHDGRVALVLGAGNQMAIPATDAIHKLFVEDEVVVLKMNPVNEALGPLLRDAFGPLVARGFLEVVYGGRDVGAHLAAHPGVDTIHVTGSDATHDAIVWGPKRERAARKAAGTPRNGKPITSELGNVTPILVVPGPWTDEDIAWQARNVATMVVNNASFNCVAGKLLVTARDWDRRDDFLDAVEAELARIAPRKAWYPGARERWRTFVDAHPDKARVLTDDDERTVPWTLIRGLDPDADDEPCFSREPFCGLLAEVALPVATAVDFLPVAVDFANDRVWGTLACAVLVHPKTRRDPPAEAALQEALDELRYGGIAVNHFPGVIFGLSEFPWGAFPGHALEDIQSGRGTVHNTWLFDGTQKSVLYGPFRPLVSPPWTHDHARTTEVGRALVAFEARPGLSRLLSLAWKALRG